MSGSRDCTTCIWLPNDHDRGFTQGQTLTGHSNFVASVCILPPDDNHPQGLICTGSNDSTILLFEPGKLEPVAKLIGHSSTVCALATGRFGFLVSGSWDKTARVWLNQKCVMTLEGHNAAVWAVAVISEKGQMLTGSADKTIKMWKAGKVERTFHGHEDCVRGLAVIDDASFLSCSNDATVRQWITTGDCVNVFYGHTNFVYSLVLLPNGTDFVTSGEDRTCRVWKDGECVQTITHPTESVWCVTALANGDIVTGASDGVMRVFTREAQRMALQEDQTAFEDLVASSAIPTQLGDINKDDLPGPEALSTPGRKEGQSKMVRRGDKVELYMWDMAEARWNKVGDIVGSTGGSQKTSGKTLFEGQEYDYVFTVDVQEGKPALKLPYNAMEDPWQAAQLFIHKHGLSQLFLDQVANFIVENVKGVTLSTGSAGYIDPFTGDNRYVPGSKGGASGDMVPASAVDPFTGANSYRPPGSANPPSGTSNSGAVFGADPFTGAGSYKPAGSSSATSSSSKENYFPVTSPITIDTVNPAQIIGKLLEFNQAVGADVHVDDEALKNLEQLLSGQPTDANIATLQKILEWPADKLFPALDVLRTGVKHAAVCQAFCKNSVFLPFMIRQLTNREVPANTMLALRTVANLFSHTDGAKLMSDNQTQVLEAVVNNNAMTTKNSQIAQSTAVLNFSVDATAKQDFERKSECVRAVAHLLESGSADLDGEAAFRLLVALGTLVSGDELCLAVVQSLNVGPSLQALKNKTNLNKVIECADLLLKL